MKLLSSLMIFALLCAALGRTAPAARAQTRKNSGYDAALIVKKGTRADRKPVVISNEGGNLKISSAKGDEINKSVALSAIKTADYSYSEKPRVKEALLGSFLFTNWVVGLGLLFTKTKKHWLVLAAGEETFLFELQNDNYRRLLFELNAKGVPVEDLGDRDRQEKGRSRPPAPFVEGETCGGGDF